MRAHRALPPFATCEVPQKAHTAGGAQERHMMCTQCMYVQHSSTLGLLPHDGDRG